MHLATVPAGELRLRAKLAQFIEDTYIFYPDQPRIERSLRELSTTELLGEAARFHISCRAIMKIRPKGQMKLQS